MSVFCVNWFSSTCSFQVIFALEILLYFWTTANLSSDFRNIHFSSRTTTTKWKQTPSWFPVKIPQSTLSFAVVNAIKLAMHDKGENKCVTTWNFFSPKYEGDKRALDFSTQHSEEETRAIQRAVQRVIFVRNAFTWNYRLPSF